MKFTAVVSVACVVAGACAFEYPDFVPLHKRQEPGTPQYECHANCGGIITASRQDGYCDSSDFEPMLNDCLNCALVYDIWKYYGNSVSAAAEKCGLDATPVEPGSSSSSSSIAQTATPTDTATETETEPTATPTDTTTETISAPVESTAESTTSVSSTPVIPSASTTAAPAPPGSSTSGAPAPSSPVFTGGAVLNAPAGLFMGGLLGSFMAGLF